MFNFNFDIERTLALLPALIAFISVFIEVSPIKLNPVTILVEWIASIINKETHVKLAEIESSTNKNSISIEELRGDIDKRFNKYDEETQEQKAVDMRNEIINFAENLRLGRKYSERQYEYILNVVTDYYNHCSKYDIKNHFIDEAHSYIRKIYRREYTKIGEE